MPDPWRIPKPSLLPAQSDQVRAIDEFFDYCDAELAGDEEYDKLRKEAYRAHAKLAEALGRVMARLQENAGL